MTMTSDIKLPSNLTLKEVHHRNFFFHLAENTAAFAREVLKLKVKSVTPGRLTMEMPFTPDLVGNPQPESMHGGVIAAAIDHTAGAHDFGHDIYIYMIFEY
jgi:acyl-coenzyme A thioesterase PaaI-like protein